MAFPVASHAASDTWTGATDSSWATNTNWTTSPAVVPGTGDTATFNNNTAGAAQTILTGNIQIRTILFDTAGAAAYTLGGATAGSGQITLDDTGAVTMNSAVAANQLINANLILGTATLSSYTLTNASTTNSLTFAGSIQGGTGGTAGIKTLNVNGAGGIVLGGTITLGGASGLVLAVANTGTTTLSGTGSTFSTLGVSTGAGNVTVAADVTLNGGTLINGSGGTINTSGGRILLGVAAGDIGVSTGGTLTINAVIANGTQSSVDFFNTANGTGIVVLTADNTFSGTTNLQSGVITVSKIGNAGVAGNLGTNATINIGSSSTTSATLRYAGPGTATGETNDRVINLSGTTAGATLDASGGGLLKFTSDLTATGAGSKTLTLTGTGTGEIGGKIVDNSATNKTSVAKSGAGTWTLSGSNTYTGTTTISAGTLRLANANALAGGGAVVIGGTSSFDNTSGAALTLNNALTMSSASPTFLGTDNLTFTGTTTVTGANRTVTVNGAVLTLGSVTDSGQARSLTKAGAGTLTLATAAGTWTGGMVLSAGTLNVNLATALGTGTASLGGGVLNNTSGAAITLANSASITGSFTFGTAGNTSANNLTFSGTTAFSQDLTRTITLAGTGVTLTVGATWNNSIDSSGRTLTVNGAGNTFVLAGLALDNVAAGVTHTHSIAGTGNVTITGAVVNGVATGSQALTYSGSGTLTLNGNSTYAGLTTMNNATGTLTLAGNNSGAAGGVTLTTGRLNINNARALASGTFTISAGTIDNTSGAAVTNTGNNAITVGGSFAFGGTNDLNLGTGAVTGSIVRTVTLNGTATLTMGGTWGNTNDADGTFTVNGSGNTLMLGGLALVNGGTTARTQTIAGSGNVTFTGAIVNGTSSGTQRLAVTNTGIVTLQGANTYTGTTSVTTGTLLLGNGGSLAATAVTVGAGATFGARPGVTGASNSMASSLTLSSGASFTMQDGATSTLTVGTTTAFTGGVGSTLAFDLGGAVTAADRLTIAGAASGTGGTVIDIKGIGSTAPTTGAYTIISAASGLNLTNFALSQNKVVIGGVAYEITLTKNAATTVLNVTGNTGLNQAWWTGDQSALWNTNNTGNTNWATDSTGATESGAIPTSVTDVFFSASGATNLSNGLGANTTINSLTFTSGSGAVTLAAGQTLTIGSVSGITVQSGAAAQTIEAAVALTTTQAWTNDSSNALTVNGVVSGTSFGITKRGNGTLVLGASNSYTGSTTIDNGTLRMTASQTLTGGLIFGASNGVTTLGNLDLSNAGATFGAGLVRTNNVTANTVTVGAGQTLSLTGGLTMGYDAVTGSGAVTSNLTLSGAGSFSITGTTVTISANQAATNAGYFSAATLDLTGLGSGSSGFSANVTNFNVGVGSTTTGTGAVLLSNVANTLAATTLQIGNSGGNNGNGATSSIILGTGTNVIKADTINIGLSKVGGTLAFASQSPGSPGTINITNKAGNGAANMVIGSHNGTGTAAVLTGLVDLRGHTANVTAGTLSLGLSNNTNTGSATGTVFFDSGTFTASTVTLGSKAGTAGTGTGTGNLNIGGGSFTVNSLGTFTMATNSAATGAAVGNLNVTGGVFTSNVDILKGGGTNTTANVTLNGASASGAVMDLTGHNLGSATQAINFATQVGTLKNVAEINGGTTGLLKNTAGTLLLTGTNTYTGATVVSAGTVQVGSGNTGSTGTGSAVSVNGATAVLSGTGTVNGETTIVSGHLSGGDNAGFDIGTLNIANNLIFNPTSASTVANFDLSGPSISDRVHVTGALTLNSNSNLVLELASYSPGLGDSFTVMDWTGLLTLNGWSAGLNFRDGSDDGGTNLDLPDISSSSWVWQVSSMTDGNTGGALTATVVVVPEPGTSLLTVLGIAGLLGRIRRKADAVDATK